MSEETTRTKCPICGATIPREEGSVNRVFPFCSERCKLADLGKWLSGEYFQNIEGRNQDEEFEDKGD